MLSIDSLSFDAADFKLAQSEPTRKVWFTPDGDGISQNYFGKAPDLPRQINSLDQLREFYMRAFGKTGARLVELSIVTVAECRALKLIIRMPQESSGFSYIGTLTIPFRDFSFVLKGQCEERGTTGIRESRLLDRKMREGTVKLDDAGRFVGDWNPDSEAYDEEFGSHPLSRLRKILGRFESTAQVDESLLGEPPFQLPIGG